MFSSLLVYYYFLKNDMEHSFALWSRVRLTNYIVSHRLPSQQKCYGFTLGCAKMFFNPSVDFRPICSFASQPSGHTKIAELRKRSFEAFELDLLLV